MYRAAGDTSLQKTLLKLLEEKSGEHRVISKPIPLRATFISSKYASVIVFQKAGMVEAVVCKVASRTDTVR